MCTSPLEVENGYVAFESLISGSAWAANNEAVYKCFTYYGLVDSDRLTCDGSAWTGVKPKCEYHQRTEIVFWLVLVLLLLLLLALLALIIFLCCYFCRCCKRHGKGNREDEERGSRRKRGHDSADSNRRKRDDSPSCMKDNADGGCCAGCCVGCCGEPKDKAKRKRRNRSRSPRQSRSSDRNTYNDKPSRGCCAGCCDSKKENVTERDRSPSPKSRSDSSIRENQDSGPSDGCCKSCCRPRKNNNRQMNRKDSRRDSLQSRRRRLSTPSTERKRDDINEDTSEVKPGCCGCCYKSKPKKKQNNEPYSEANDEEKPTEKNSYYQEPLRSDIGQQPIRTTSPTQAKEAEKHQPIVDTTPVVYSRNPVDKNVEDEMETFRDKESKEQNEREKQRENERSRTEDEISRQKRRGDLDEENYGNEQQKKETDEELKGLNDEEDKMLKEEERERRKELEYERQKAIIFGRLRKDEEKEDKRQRELENERYRIEQQQKQNEEEMKRLNNEEDEMLKVEEQRQKELDYVKQREITREEEELKEPEKPVIVEKTSEQSPYRSVRENYFRGSNNKYSGNEDPSKTSDISERRRKKPRSKRPIELINSNDKYIRGALDDNIGRKGTHNPKVYDTLRSESLSARDDYSPRQSDAHDHIKSSTEEKNETARDKKRVKLINSNDKYVRGLASETIGQKGTKNPLVYKPYKIEKPVFTDLP